MPGEDIYSWSTVAADNGSADTLINWVEGQARASVNNSARGNMAAHAKNRKLLTGAIVTTGTANAQAFLSGNSYTAIPLNMLVRLKVGAGLTNTGSTTLNMDGIGATLVVDPQGRNLSGGEFTSNDYIELLWNGSNWVFLYSRGFIDASSGGIVLSQQVFSTAGTATYTPSAGMECCIIECVGGGGGGGLALVGLTNEYMVGGGGGSGAYTRALKTANDVGASQTVTVGAGGVGGHVGGGDGGGGGGTSVGALCIANGGAGGLSAASSQVPQGGQGGGAGTSAPGEVHVQGTSGESGSYNNNNTTGTYIYNSGTGGSSVLGGGSQSFANSGVHNPGFPAGNYGGGGGGGSLYGIVGNVNGGAGSPGVVIITEFAGRGNPGVDGVNGAPGATGPMGPAGPSGSGTGDVLRSGVPTSGQIAQWTDASHITGIAAASVAVPSAPQGRLTLQSATPVMTATQVNQTTIYYTPYVGSLVPIYNGTNFIMTSIGSEISVATTDTTKSPAAIGANKVNDWFVWNDAGTAIRLGHGPDWTNDITRSAGSALVRVNGFWLNNAAITNGPAAQRGTYVGTTRSDGASQLNWVLGTSAVGGGTALLAVWNAYNRVNVATTVIEAAANWNATGLIQPFNSSINNRVSAVFGLAEDEATAFAVANVSGAASGIAAIGIGYNVTNSLHGSWTSSSYNTNGVWSAAFGQYSIVPLGFNFWQWMEYSGTGTNSFAGNFPTVGAQSSLQFRARM